jgi:L-asparaginase II
MTYEQYQPLIEVTRGGMVESVHWGALAVVDVHGRLLASFGDPQASVFLRSSAKPFQALTLIELGGAERFGLSDREIAILCASHSGTDEHAQTVAGIQAKIGATEGDLLCGVHPPMDEAARVELLRRGEEPTPNRHNCSGKHTGMLAQARLRGFSFGHYLDFDHPVQQANLKAFSEMCGLPPQEVRLGIDGCSAPVFACPLYHAALGYARLADPLAAGLAAARAAACQRISGAMIAHPEMVAGAGRFDTLLMQAGAGKILAKMGAEGYQGIGLLPGALGEGSAGIGIAIKIADGDLNGRAVPLVTLEVLRQLGALNRSQLAALQAFDRRPMRNWRGLEVGEIRPIFKLARNGQPA